MKITPLVDEKEVLERLLGGDERAFNEIHRHYKAFLFGNILKMVQDTDVAKDLVQDVFIKIWEKRSKINPEKSFPSFLFTCAKNLVLNYLKRVSIEKHVAAYLTFQNSELYYHVEEEVNYKETNTMYNTIVSNLPPQCQNAYRLCREEGLSYEEAAKELKVTISTIRNHIIKANKIIKEQMSLNSTTLFFTAFILSFYMLF